MSRLSDRSWWIAVAALLAIVATTSVARPAAAADASLDLSTSATDAVVLRELPMEQALLDATNLDRAQNGLPPLEFDNATLDIARQRAASQLGPNNLTHYDSQGLLAFVGLLDQAGLKYGLSGENLARSPSTGPETVGRIEEALMKSPTHRKNILEQRFNRVSIGLAVDEAGRVAFAEIFRGD